MKESIGNELISRQIYGAHESIKLAKTNTGMRLKKGSDLRQSFNVVSQAYEEIDTLIANLKLMMNEKIAPGAHCDEEWVQRGRSNGFNDNFIVSWELEGNEGLFVGFQICLHGDGMNIGESDEPLVHVFRWNCGRYYASLGCNMGYMYETEFKLLPDIWGDSLMVWPDDDGNEFQWTFSLRLAALSDKKSLEERIGKPIAKLLENSAMTKRDYASAPLTPWDGLVVYDQNKIFGYPLGLNPRSVGLSDVDCELRLHSRARNLGRAVGTR